MVTEHERMLAGELYDPNDPALVGARARARTLLRRYRDAAVDDECGRSEVLHELLGACGARLRIEPPFWCDYGSNISVGDDVYFNFNAVILDCAAVRIGDRFLAGPGVQILAATHPVDAATRRAGRELARPVTIGDDVWLGGGVVVGPGVTIGSRSVVGAGSVVVRDLPSDVVAAGNPCRVVRSIA